MDQRERARRGGLARARQFTPESQAAAARSQSREAKVLAGRKGAQATIARHGMERFLEKAREWRLAHPSGPERQLMALLADLGREDYQREYLEPFIDLPHGACLDFAWPAEHRAIEVDGGVHTPALDPDGHRAAHLSHRRQLLRDAGWDLLVLTPEDLTTARETVQRFLTPGVIE